MMAQQKGVPVTVDPQLLKNEMGAIKFDNKILIGNDNVTYTKISQKKPAAPAKTVLLQTVNPVENPPFNNWSVNQPSQPHRHGLEGTENWNQNIIIDGHHVKY
jgi:hypothetical protein